MRRRSGNVRIDVNDARPDGLTAPREVDAAGSGLNQSHRRDPADALVEAGHGVDP
jgi:hypothetical protein